MTMVLVYMRARAPPVKGGSFSGNVSSYSGWMLNIDLHYLYVNFLSCPWWTSGWDSRLHLNSGMH